MRSSVSRKLSDLLTVLDWGSLTVGHLVGPLAFLVHHDDDHQQEDLRQHAQEGPERRQVAAHPKDGGDGLVADDVAGIAAVLPRILADLQADDGQLCVVVLVHDEVAAR